MILPLFGLAVALQTVAQMVKNLAHFGMADGMLAPSQGIGDGSRALASPAHRRFGPDPRLLSNQPPQPFDQLRRGYSNGLPSSTRTAVRHSKPHPGYNFLDSLPHRLS